MTQEKPPDHEDTSLYRELEKTPERPLQKSVGDREELDPDQAERRKRGHQDKVTAAWGRVKRAGLWAAFCAACILGLALVAFTIVLLWFYGEYVIEGGHVAAVWSNIMTFGAGVVVTLAVEYLYHRNNGS